MSVTVSNMVAIVTVCCTLLSGAYGLIISPLKTEVTSQKVILEQYRETVVITGHNSENLKKQDIRIEQNRKQIQLQEISAAKREVQMVHLTEAIRQLNELLKDMNKHKGVNNG